jgi:hypothetical protein
LHGGVKSIKVETSSNSPLNKDDNVHDDNRVSHDTDGQSLGKDFDVDGIPLDQDDADGEPLDEDEDIDGEPFDMDNVDGEQLDELDGGVKSIKVETSSSPPLNKDDNVHGDNRVSHDGKPLDKDLDVDGIRLDQDDADGEPVVKDEYIDGEPFAMENADVKQLEKLDGVVKSLPSLNKDDNVHDGN